MPANKTFSKTDIERFYDYLSDQFAPILESETHLGRVYRHNPISIHEVLKSFSNNQTVQQRFPKGIETIFTPIHLNVINKLRKTELGGWKDRISFNIADHLTLDEGTPEFVVLLDTYAESMYHEGRIKGKPDRTCLLRFMEEAYKEHEINDENQVSFNYDYIYKTKGNGKLISNFELQDIRRRLNNLNAAQIQHYIPLSFDEIILPKLIASRQNDWSSRDYRPEESWEYTHLADEETKLQRHLRKRIINQKQADLVYDELINRISGDRSLHPATQNLLMDLAIARTDMGYYDNGTFTGELKLPQAEPIQQTNHMARSQNTDATGYSFFLVLPAAILVFACIFTAKSLYRCGSTLFASKPVVANNNNAQGKEEVALLVASDGNESDEEETSKSTLRRRNRFCGYQQ